MRRRFKATLTGERADPNPRALTLAMTVTTGSKNKQVTLQIQDFKGCVTGSQFNPEHVIDVISSALSAKFGGRVHELSSGG